MEVICSLDATREIPDFDEMPLFEVVAISAPPGTSDWAVTNYVLRFVWVRRPVCFPILRCKGEGFRTNLAEASRAYEYEVSLISQGGPTLWPE